MKLPSTTENASLIVYWSSCGSISRPVYILCQKKKSSFEFSVVNRRKFAALECMARCRQTFIKMIGIDITIEQTEGSLPKHDVDKNATNLHN